MTPGDSNNTSRRHVALQPPHRESASTCRPFSLTSSEGDGFWRFVKKDSECWEWTGPISQNGYGLFFARRSIKAHRASWFLHNGEIPLNLFVLHRCDNRKCVNPSHLFLGTCLDNHRDMIAKGRKASQVGEQNSQAKLKSKHVAVIKAGRSMGLSSAVLAGAFNVSIAHINRICRGKKWAVIG